MLSIIIPLLLLNINYIYNLYDYLSIEYSTKDIFIIGTTILNIVVYWSLGLLYLSIDLYPKFLSKYKIQPSINPIYTNPGEIYSIVKLVSFNQLIITPLCCLVLYNYMTFSNTIPTAFIVLHDIIVSTIATEFVFYYSHRLLHIPYLYKSIHQIHHIYRAPMAITALYTHPIEYVISNIFPIVIGPIICKSHIITIWIWQIIALTNTITSHSGYNFFNYKALSGDSHDIHHMRYKYNYGVLNILDYLHGTLYKPDDL